MKRYLGIELGSTRIKGVIIDEKAKVIASGSHTWENELKNGLWTYSQSAIFAGLKDCYSDLKKNYESATGEKLESVDSIGFSGMMHGYIALDENDNMLVPFRTWRNTNAKESAQKLTSLLGAKIPIRWSISHLYQCVLDGEEHLPKVKYITTLSGYIHYLLTGEKVLGACEASGMFPLGKQGDYDQEMLDKFDALIEDKNYPWKIRDILPKVLFAGQEAGRLKKESVKILDESETLKANIPLCPPEGDGGTGMVATNAIKKRKGNVSAGTSVFTVVVMEKPLSKVHEEIDVLNTPDGAPVAMVQCNNCTSDINAWAGLFADFAKAIGKEISTGELMSLLFNSSLEGDEDCGGIISYNFFSGEPIVGANEGRPLLVRTQDAKMTLANFMKAQIYSSLASLAIGMEILEEEKVEIDEMYGHGGFFKTPQVGQRAMSCALSSPVTVMETAGEGGAWGMALLASFLGKTQSLGEYLDGIFANESKITLSATEQDKKDFASFVEKYKKALPLIDVAVKTV